MVAFPDHNNAERIVLGAQEASKPVRGFAPGRVFGVFAGVGLCLAAPGLWLMPSMDPSTQLVKLCVSFLLLGAGTFLLSRHSRTRQQTVDQDAPPARLRVREYDLRGRAVLRGK